MKEDRVLKTLNSIDNEMEKIAIILLWIAIPLNIIGFAILVLLMVILAVYSLIDIVSSLFLVMFLVEREGVKE